MNQALLSHLGGHIMTECLGQVVSSHSDTEIGRCVFRFAPGKTNCTHVKGFYFRQLYYQQIGPRVFPMSLISTGQMSLVFPQTPKYAHFNAPALHPLKHEEDFYRFHKQVVTALRPVQPNISEVIIIIIIIIIKEDDDDADDDDDGNQEEEYERALE